VQYVARELRVGPACSEDAMQKTADMWRVKKYESRLCFAAFTLWLLHSMDIHTAPQVLLPKERAQTQTTDERLELRPQMKITVITRLRRRWQRTWSLAHDFRKNPWLVVGTSGSSVPTVHNQPHTNYSVQASVGDISRKAFITILLHVHRHPNTSLILNYNSWQEQQHQQPHCLCCYVVNTREPV